MEASYADFLRFAEEKKVDSPVLETLYDEFLAPLTPSDQPELIAIGGSPGAGKTTYRKQFLNLKNFHLHDMDEVMIRIPAYQEDLAAVGPKAAFEKWWPRARELAQLLVLYAIQSKFSILYDRTCGAEGSYFDLVNAKKQGYRIHLIGLYVDPEIARERILKREKEEGRAMTEAIFMEYRARFSALWPYYLHLADETELFQTNSATPALIYSSKAGIHDAMIYEKFLQDGSSFRSYFAEKLKIINIDKVQLWYETFGQKNDPALLLIMAAGGQGIMWPSAFCEQLANRGFYVIRYDHRDMGLSTPINFNEAPYDLIDLSRDAISILDALSIQKAHIVGLSMGGSLAAIMGKEFPDRILTLSMINSTSDLSTFLDPTEKNPTPLPKPKSEYLAWVKQRNAALEHGVTLDEKIDLFIETWKILNGSESTFDHVLYRHLVIESLQRSKNPNGFDNHMLAMKASTETLKNCFNSITVPVLIIHGTASPVFAKEHALDLAEKIPGARIEFVQGMGHILNPIFYDQLQELIISQTREHVEK